MDEGRVTWLDRVEIRREMTGGQALHHHAGGRPVVDIVGRRHQRARGMAMRSAQLPGA